MAAPIPLQVPASRQEALQLLASAPSPLEDAQLVLVAEYTTNQELLDQRNRTKVSSSKNMTYRLGNACDLYALAHNQLPGIFRFHLMVRRCNNLEAALGGNNSVVKSMRVRIAANQKGDEWIPPGLSLPQIATYRAANGEPTCDALLGRIWEHMESDPNFELQDIQDAFGYKSLASAGNFVQGVKALGPGISQIMATSQPTTMAVSRGTSLFVPPTPTRKAVRRERPDAPQESLPTRTDSPVPDHFVWLPPVVSNDLPPATPEPSSRQQMRSTPTPTPALSVHPTTPLANTPPLEVFPVLPNLTDVAYGHQGGADILSWFPGPRHGPPIYVTSIAALYIGLINGRNVRIIETRSEDEIEEGRLRTLERKYR